MSISDPGEKARQAVLSIVLNEEQLRRHTTTCKRNGTGEGPSRYCNHKMFTEYDWNILKNECPNIYRSQISRLLSGVYAITLLAFGILFPMAEAIQDMWLQSIPNGVRTFVFFCP